MTWRDDPRIIWRDEDGNWLWCGDDARYLQTPAGGVYAPGSPGEWDELLHRLAAVGGRRITGIEDAPRPIEVGDLVHWEGVVGTYEVRHIDGDQAMVRYSKTGQAYAARLVQLRHVEAEAPEPEVRWIEQGETTDGEWNVMLAAAVDDGRRIECYSTGEWVPSSRTASSIRRFGLYGVRYRMEAPAKPEPEAEAVVCTDEHRMCVGEGTAWCCVWDPIEDSVCSRRSGHDGPHVACDPHEDEHNLESWGEGGDDQ